MSQEARHLTRERIASPARGARLLLWAARGLPQQAAGAASADPHPHQMGQSTSSPCTQRQENVQGDVEISERLPGTRVETVVVDTTELHRAVREGHTQLVEQMLQQPGVVAAAAVSAVNDSGDTCMHLAAKFGHAEIVSLLLHHGAERDRLGSRSRTPLHLASIYGHLKAVNTLLAAGADANIVLTDANGYEHWAISFASRMGHVDVLKTLVWHGANVVQAGTRGLTALHYAAVRNQAGAVHALVEAGASVEATVDESGGGGTPLHASAVMRCYDAALALLRCGANVDSKNAFGYTPLHGAARQAGKTGATRMADLLLRWGADETAVDRDGNRPADVVGNRRAEEDGESRQDETEKMRKLLANAPADRAWRRRGCLVLCRKFLRQDCGWLQRERQQRMSLEGPLALDSGLLFAAPSTRRPSKTSDPENKMWSELASAETAPQTPVPPVSAAAVALACFESATAWEEGAGENGTGVAVDKAGSGDDADGLRTFLVRLLDFPEEGVFRNIVMFL
ncbi:unnamed protein product [Scytosiphon promiscuus]